MSATCQETTFHRLFTDLAERLRNYLYYHCGDGAVAEDLVQEAFIRLWEHCQSVPPEKARAFVYKVGFNLILDMAKHKKVVRKFEAHPTDKKGPEDPQFQIEQQEFENILWQTIRDMPERNRVVFLMNRLDGMTYAEIAEHIGLSVKAVEKRMQKALEAIREIYPKF
jgi:RNA polymerase sigma-70 factor (ECF subfamily)